MEMCYLRGACRSGDSGQSGVDKDGTVAKHERQEKVRGVIWPRVQRNFRWGTLIETTHQTFPDSVNQKIEEYDTGRDYNKKYHHNLF